MPIFILFFCICLFYFLPLSILFFQFILFVLTLVFFIAHSLYQLENYFLQFFLYSRFCWTFITFLSFFFFFIIIICFFFQIQFQTPKCLSFPITISPPPPVQTFYVQYPLPRFHSPCLVFILLASLSFPCLAFIS